MGIRESEFSSKCLGDIFRLLIESYGSNLTFRKGPMDLFCFQDKFVYLDEPIAVFGYKQRVALATTCFLKSAGSFLDEVRVSWYSFL